MTIALAAQKANVPNADKEAFLNQIITWRELAVNLVRFNPNYDNFECGEPWAHRTLAAHAKDDARCLHGETIGARRDPRLTLECRPDANGQHGWMHNYMRMYWAKKILEWSPSPAAGFPDCRAIE